MDNFKTHLEIIGELKEERSYKFLDLIHKKIEKFKSREQTTETMNAIDRCNKERRRQISGLEKYYRMRKVNTYHKKLKIRKLIKSKIDIFSSVIIKVHSKDCLDPTWFIRNEINK